MKNVKHLLAGFAMGVFLAMAPSCGPAKCTAANCAAGCCDAKGECQTGTSNGACGSLGSSCQVCAITQACSLGSCSMSTSGGGNGGSNGGGTGTGGGTGGGVTGGGTGGGVTGGGTGGGVTGGGSGGGVTGGGTGGGVTGGGGGSACDGCFINGTTCIIRANSNNNTICGQGGVACATCNGTSETCQNYVCTPTGTGGGSGGGTGGGTGGGGGSTGVTVGMTCTSSTQCTGLGSNAYCKMQTSPFTGSPASPYPSGFCTLPCNTGTCPSSTVCAGGVSSYPYLFNEVDRFCTRTCTTTAGCTSGFQCIPVEPLTGASSASGCFLTISGGMGTFTGGGAPIRVGNACATDTDCANPPDPILAACETSTAFQNGYCLASSDFAPPDSWCVAAGKTELGFPLADGGTNYFCLGTCNSPGQVGSSRAGYTCFSKSSAEPTVGVLWPKCGSTTCVNSTTTPNCNATTGFCCDAAGTTCSTQLTN